MSFVDPHREQMGAAIALEAEGQRLLLDGDEAAGAARLRAAAEHYRRSWELAPPGAYGRLIGMLKAAVIAGDPTEAAAYVREQLAGVGAASSPPAQAAGSPPAQAAGSPPAAPAHSAPAAPAGSPPAHYARAIAALVEDDDEAALEAARGMRAGSPAFGRAADAVEGLARRDTEGYAAAVRAIVADFEARDEHLTGVPIADTALMLERLAEPRGLAAHPASALLPA